MSDFNTALAYTLVNEGTEYTNVSSDRGGPTRYGITLMNLADWNRRKGLPAPTAHDVMDLTVEKVTPIYKEDYWDYLRLDLVELQSSATALFDIGVNQGAPTAAIEAQTILGVNPDGRIGPITAGAINKLSRSFLPKFQTAVAHRYVTIVRHDPTQLVNFDNWMWRTIKLSTLLV